MENGQYKYTRVKLTGAVKIFGCIPNESGEKNQIKAYGKVNPGSDVTVISEPVTFNTTPSNQEVVHIVYLPAIDEAITPFFIRDTDYRNKCKVVEENCSTLPVTYTDTVKRSIIVEKVTALIAPMKGMYANSEIPVGTAVQASEFFGLYALAMHGDTVLGYVPRDIFDAVADEELIEKEIATPTPVEEKTADIPVEPEEEKVQATPVSVKRETPKAQPTPVTAEIPSNLVSVIYCHDDNDVKHKRFLQVMDKLDAVEYGIRGIVPCKDKDAFAAMLVKMRGKEIPSNYQVTDYVIVKQETALVLKKKMLSLGLKPVLVK